MENPVRISLHYYYIGWLVSPTWSSLYPGASNFAGLLKVCRTPCIYLVSAGVPPNTWTTFLFGLRQHFTFWYWHFVPIQTCSKGLCRCAKHLNFSFHLQIQSYLFELYCEEVQREFSLLIGLTLNWNCPGVISHLAYNFIYVLGPIDSVDFGCHLCERARFLHSVVPRRGGSAVCALRPEQPGFDIAQGKCG